MSKKKEPHLNPEQESTENTAPQEATETSAENVVDSAESDTIAESPESIQAALEAEVAALQDQLLRNQAELQNFKRRMTEERIRDRVLANVELVRALLTPLDDFERGLLSEADNEQVKPHLKGFAMIRNSIIEVLKSQGLEEVEARDRPFDPKVHQAVATEKQPDIEPGKVTEVYQKGYLFKDRLIRPAMVKVSE